MVKYPSAQVFAFDGTISQLPKENAKIHFIKKNIGSENNVKKLNAIKKKNPTDKGTLLFLLFINFLWKSCELTLLSIKILFFIKK